MFSSQSVSFLSLSLSYTHTPTHTHTYTHRCPSTSKENRSWNGSICYFLSLAVYSTAFSLDSSRKLKPSLQESFSWIVPTSAEGSIFCAFRQNYTDAWIPADGCHKAVTVAGRHSAAIMQSAAHTAWFWPWLAGAGTGCFSLTSPHFIKAPGQPEVGPFHPFFLWRDISISRERDLFSPFQKTSNVLLSQRAVESHMLSLLQHKIITFSFCPNSFQRKCHYNQLFLGQACFCLLPGHKTKPMPNFI